MEPHKMLSAIHAAPYDKCLGIAAFDVSQTFGKNALGNIKAMGPWAKVEFFQNLIVFLNEKSRSTSDYLDVMTQTPSQFFGFFFFIIWHRSIYVFDNLSAEFAFKHSLNDLMDLSQFPDLNDTLPSLK